MPQMNGAPDLAVEQAPPALQNLVAGCNAFLASLSSSRDALDAQRSAAQGGSMGSSPLDGALEEAVQAQQQLAGVVESGADDVLSDQHVDALDSAAAALSQAADDLSRGTSISDDTRKALERSGEQLKGQLQEANARATELAQPPPTNASDADLADHLAAQSQANTQVQTLQAATQLTDAATTAANAATAPVVDNLRSAVEAAQSLAQQSQAAQDAQNSAEVEARVAERMAREGK